MLAAKYVEIIALLGGIVKPNDSHWLIEFYLDRNGYTHTCGIIPQVSGNRKKLKIYVSKPEKASRQINKHESDKLWNDLCSKVNVAENRPAEDIVKDIDRRIEWDKIDQYLSKVDEETAKHKELVEKHKELVDTLVEACKGKKRETAEELITYIRPADNGGSYTMNGECIRVDNQSVTFDLRSVTKLHVAKKLCEALSGVNQS